MIRISNPCVMTLNGWAVTVEHYDSVEEVVGLWEMLSGTAGLRVTGLHLTNAHSATVLMAHSEGQDRRQVEALVRSAIDILFPALP